MTTRCPKLSVEDHNGITAKGYAWIYWQEFDYKIEKRDGVYFITRHNGECALSTMLTGFARPYGK